MAAVAGLTPAAMQARITSLGLVPGMVAAMARTISTGRIVVEGRTAERMCSWHGGARPAKAPGLISPARKHAAHSPSEVDPGEVGNQQIVGRLHPFPILFL